MNFLTIKIGGAAGEGIMAAGLIFSKALTKAGLYIATANEYPSLIRGGHNVYIIRASNEEIFSLVRPVDLLVALNKETIDLHKDELSDGAGLIYDSTREKLDLSFPADKNVSVFPIPLLELATKGGGAKIMINNVALGAGWAVIGLPFEYLSSVVVSVFEKKGKEVINENLAAAKAGFDYIKNNFKTEFKYVLGKGNASERMVLSGNEAIGLGAIAANLEFAALYPMTPINGLLTFLAGHEDAGFLYKQPEDEISGINMAIGASYAGKRSLVATSGGGFSLMVEGYSMAAMCEIPLVIVMGQRGGPSSGLPTWTSQGDLKFVLSASQGDFMRVVLAPSDWRECFEMTQIAFNLSDRYQTPVIILVDKYLCESLGTIEKIKMHPSAGSGSKIKIDRGKVYDKSDKDYKRYKITEDGISPRAFPGQTYFATNSYEHDEIGLSTEDAEEIAKMQEKRGRKYALLEKEAPEPLVYGSPDNEITLVGWGSTKGAIIEALGSKEWEVGNEKVNYLHLNWINPFPKEAVTRILSKAKKIIDVEANFTGQMAGWIREQTGIEIKDKILKYDGRPFVAEDIIEGIKKIFNSKFKRQKSKVQLIEYGK